MNPVLLEYSSIVVYTYGFSLCIGSLLATFLVWRRARRLGYSTEQIFDMSLLAGLSALVFARVFYVLQHWSDFQGSALQMILVTYFPGLDGIGAVLGIILAVCAFTFMLKWKPLEIFDSVFYGLGLGIVVIMVGTFFSGGLAGVQTGGPWGVLYPGLEGVRHPVALYWLGAAVIYALVVFALDWKLQKNGWISSAFLLYFGLLIFALTPLTDFVVNWGAFPMPYYFGLMMVLLGVLLGGLLIRRK